MMVVQRAETVISLRCIPGLAKLGGELGDPAHAGLLLWCATAALFLTFVPARRLRRHLPWPFTAGRVLPISSVMPKAQHAL